MKVRPTFITPRAHLRGRMWQIRLSNVGSASMLSRLLAVD
jgi:hypothetical protein